MNKNITAGPLEVIKGGKVDPASFKTAGETKTPRVENLRDYLLKTVPEISSERMRFYTRSYKETETEPKIMRRAKALRTMLANMSIYILDGELIVGNTSRHPRSV